jgi:hypothetical protein
MQWPVIMLKYLSSESKTVFLTVRVLLRPESRQHCKQRNIKNVIFLIERCKKNAKLVVKPEK